MRAHVFVIASIVLAACSSSKGGFDGDGGAQTDSGTSDAPVVMTDASFQDVAPPPEVINCSSDLHDVLDDQGNVVMTCPPDQGCGPNGTCVAACDSAIDNKSTIGCEYYSVDPDIIKPVQGACFAAYVANTWSTPVTLAVDLGGNALDATTFARIPNGTGENLTYAPLTNGQIQPGEVAILFLAHMTPSDSTNIDVPCPAGITPAITTDAAVHGTGIGSAFHITTSAPTVAYDILPYGGGSAAATSATLLLPTSVWDTNYVAVNAFFPTQYKGNAQSLDPNAAPSMDIVAQEDATHITIKPVTNILAAGGVTAATQGQSQTYTLDKGQVLQFTQPLELTGSPIQSDKPIGVWGAASQLTVETDTCCADSAHQQIPPVSALGNEYVGVKYRDRYNGTPESLPFRLVGLVNGTTLTYDGAMPAGAPTTLNLGDVVEMESTDVFVVHSQDDAHPFYLSAHMTGCTTYAPNGMLTNDCRGDSEYVNVVPGKQYLSSYTFFTDPTYPEVNLVITRALGKNGFADVTLDCYGTLANWQPIGTSGAYQFTRVDLSTGNFEGVGKCDNGRHQMSSTAPFNVTVWGWGSATTGGAYNAPNFPGFYTQAVSYAYPAGMSVHKINNVVVAPN
jgi:hypothetical protein